ncbi:hypothetical protein CDL15_Pgr017550 [Punica granatum]|uniref:Uncharacterized protein n=1 Tax=Punica granatum TaxID=22663 RepID=A0A218W7A6_PUNGR|nr:hypothetical protein CDL15_Pgr017550 [Punica granatum]PKI34311.1 hypothetical protein CRG98_045309 [Punica granatum]
MSSAGCGSGRFASSAASFVALLQLLVVLVSLLQIWVLICCDCRAAAIRLPPPRTAVSPPPPGDRKAELLHHKYFGNDSNGFGFHQKGLEDGKRRVPSCPDPLHN